MFNVLLSNEAPGPSCSQPDSSKPETSRLKGRSQIVVYAFLYVYCKGIMGQVWSRTLTHNGKSFVIHRIYASRQFLL